MLRGHGPKFNILFVFVLMTDFALTSCVTRGFGPEIERAKLHIEQVYALTPNPLVWPKVSLLRVLAPDTISVSIPGVVGSQVISLAGVRSARSEHLETWRTAALARYAPGGKINVMVFARGERGRIFANVLDERGSVSVWLAEQGLVLPFLLCRGIDDCSAETFSRLGVAEIAAACERATHKVAASASEAASTRAVDFSMEELLAMRIEWVGDIRTKEYAPVRYVSDVPPCQRVYFQAQDYPEVKETERSLPQTQESLSMEKEAEQTRGFGPSKSNFKLKRDYRLSRSTQL